MRKAFLSPWQPMVKDIWLYSLAAAQQATQVAVHATRLVVNHHHTTVTPEADGLSEFLRRLHRDASCALNTLLAHERYDAPGEVFDGRSTHAMRLLDAPAQVTQLVYEQNNCIAAGLVARPEHMPDHIFDFELWKRDGVVVQRPSLYFDKSRPSELQLVFTPPPLLMREFDGDIDRLIYAMKRLSEHTAQHLRRARRGKPPLGAQAVRRLHPWNEPRSLRERRGERVPTYRLGARGIDGCLAAAAAAHETKTFRHEHRDARLLRKAGDLAAMFPFGTYAAVMHQGAPAYPCAKDTAFVTAPGPLLADVLRDVEQGRSLQAAELARAKSIALLEDAHLAIDEEAVALVASDEMSFDPPRRSADTSTTTLPSERQQAVVRQQLSRSSHQPATAPRRVITLRDARRGRPQNKHGADPPV